MAFHMMRITKRAFGVALLAAVLLTSCSGGKTTPTEQLTQPEPTATATALPEPKRLVVCLGEEPQSLYLYGSSSQATWSVLEAIYDGPIDVQNYEQVPVILEELPTLENGGVALGSVAVTQGDRVANIEGDVVALQKGVKVFPDGCTSPTCAVEWDGASELSLVQMSATFQLLPGLKWSDGEPLTAADSVYSYELSADAATNVAKKMIELTQSYQAANDLALTWTAIPGYMTKRPASFFWIPQPKHLLESYTAEELNTSDLTNKAPIGWGAYQIAEWTPGEEIRLIKNPNYFKASEELPKFDEVIYRFLPALPEADLSPMVTGECDIMDVSTGLEDQIQPVRELELAGELTSYFGQGPAWEGINFGIKPATYDEVYNPYVDRMDFFSDVRTRQAFAYCVNRDSIVRDLLFSQSAIPISYLPSAHPLAVSGLTALPHDPTAGIALLEQVGWVDSDGDLATPRTSLGVADVFDGTPFAVTYTLTDTSLHRQVADVVVSSLQECGIQVTPQYVSVSELLAAGPDGTLFGRNFDLAELSWSSGSNAPCFLYSTSEIPSPKNSWLGTKYGGVNLTGYSNAEYDAACTSLLTAGMDEVTFNESNTLTQQILAIDLPVLPLFYQIKAMVAQNDLCGLSMDTSSRSALRGIESYERSETCAGN